MEELGRNRRGPDRQRGMRKGMYILPSLFTTANIAAGFYAILQTVFGNGRISGIMDFAAKAIGFAVLFDGLDGRIARMTHTESDFGQRAGFSGGRDHFGVAPALLAWMWGFHLLPMERLFTGPALKITELARLHALDFLWRGRAVWHASILRRIRNLRIREGPGKKYFVGMPIPAGAGVIAACVHFAAGEPMSSWWTAAVWLTMVVVVGYLMVSTWRFSSFKDIDFRSRRSFRLIVLFSVIFASIWFFSRQALFASRFSTWLPACFGGCNGFFAGKLRRTSAI